jgi:ribosomal protein S18 acetylase RimI-like enzyme
MTCQVFRDRLHARDPKAIVELVERTAVFSKVETGWAEELARESLAKGSACDIDFLLAELDEALAGFACFGPIEGAPGRFDLYWIAVDPDRQGKGLGAKLLQAAIARARASGCAIMYIETSTRSDYAPARALYARAGFNCEAVLKDFYRDSDGKAIFSKRF